MAESAIFAEPEMNRKLDFLFAERIQSHQSGFRFLKLELNVKMGIISNFAIKKVSFSMEITLYPSFNRPLTAEKIW